MRSIKKMGFYSSLFVSITVASFAVLLCIGLFVETAMLSFGACLILAPCFVVMIISVFYITPTNNKIWGHIGISFAIIYAVLILITYYTQLAVVRTNSIEVSNEVLKLFEFTPGSFLFSIDMLGYGFMCLATLAISQVFINKGISKWIKRFSIIHGFFFIPTITYPLLSFPQEQTSIETAAKMGSLALIAWCIIFIPIPILLVKYFKDMKE